MILCVWRTFFVIFYLTVTCASEASTIFDKLKYFETLKVTDLSHFITKRGTQPSKHKFSTIKEVSFKAHGRDFRLILNPSKGLLSAHFKAYTVDGSGNKRPVWVDQNQFFEGRVFGELDSNVSAHMDDGVMTASIRVKNDIYVVEPSWRHIPQDSNATMIVYRASDVKYSWDPTHGAESLTKYCGYVKEGANSSLESAGDAAENSGHWEGHGKGGGGSSHVEKRQAMEPYHWEPVQTRCSLLLVADHRFYENMGGRNLKSTINFLITLIDRVNKIFLDTEWRDSDRHPGFRGMGFVIQEVMVHTEPTPVLRNEVHYNMAGVTWNVRDLLEVFSRSLNHRWFCLAHLFTDQKFEGGILGLAYVGSPRRNSITLIDRVNKIFLDTEWRDSDRHPGFRGMGFVIQEVMVHTEPTPVLRNEVHYNMAGVTWNVRDLLESRSSSEQCSKVAPGQDGKLWQSSAKPSKETERRKRGGKE
ncbi:ADAM 17-like protease isoform X4 [Ixodes scapularis]